MRCSLGITRDSAWTTRLQSDPVTSRALDMTANPARSARAYRTSGAEPSWYDMPQLGPPRRTSLWFQPGWGLHGDQPRVGSYNTPMLYWPRSIVPVSTRTTNGTV